MRRDDPSTHGSVDRFVVPDSRLTRAVAPRSRLWLWVLVAFALQFAAWTAWFVLASKNPVQEVPLAPRG